jgi:hypothetical protein
MFLDVMYCTIVARHSPILLSQIPPPRGGSGARWEADAPLDVVFYCLEQTQPKRRTMGARLMTLVNNMFADRFIYSDHFVG